MANYAAELLTKTDDQLITLLSEGVDANPKQMQVKFEMQRRIINKSLDATSKATVATEKYTRYTLWIFFATLFGAFVNLAFQVYNAFCSNIISVKIMP